MQKQNPYIFERLNTKVLACVQDCVTAKETNKKLESLYILRLEVGKDAVGWELG